METIKPTKLLYAPDVAEMLNRSESGFRYMVHAGTAPRSAKIAGRRVWRLSDVEAYIEAAFNAEVSA